MREGGEIAVIVINEVSSGDAICTADYRIGTTSALLGSDFEAGKSYLIHVNDRIYRMADGVLTDQQSSVEPGQSYDKVRVEAGIEGVQLLATRSIPAQYSLSITSVLNGGCAEPAGSEASRVGDVLTVMVYNLVPAPDEPVMCTMQIGYEQVPVEIGEVPEGTTLTIHVNGLTYTLTGGDFDVMPVKDLTPDEDGGASTEASEGGESGQNEGESDSSRGYATVEIEAGIERVSVSAAKSLPSQYTVHVTSVLNGGCAEPAGSTVGRVGDVITIRVLNTVPAPDELVMCTMQIGYEDTAVAIGEIPIGETVTIRVNDRTYRLTGGEFELVAVE